MSAGQKFGWQGEGIGIAMYNLLGEGVLELKIGQDKDIYFIDKSEARELARKHNSYYTAGHTPLSVIPKSAFKKREVNGGLI